MNTTNNKQNPNNIESTSTYSSPKDIVMGDGKLTIWEILFISRYFLPIATTIGFAIGLGFMPEDGTFLMVFSLTLVVIGLLSALTVCPIKLLLFPFKCACSGFLLCRSFIPFYGIADIVAAIFGTAGGFVLGMFVVFGTPAIFTIKKFFNAENL